MAIEEVKTDPNPEVVEEIERLLTHARSGRLQSIAFMGLTAEGRAHVTGRAGSFSFLQYIGLCSVLKANLIDEMQDGDGCICGECEDNE